MVLGFLLQDVQQPVAGVVLDRVDDGEGKLPLGDVLAESLSLHVLERERERRMIYCGDSGSGKEGKERRK